MSLADTILRYLNSATLEDFMALRQEVVASHNYLPYDSYEQKSLPLLAQGRYLEAVEKLMSMMPGWLVSPGLHNALGYAHEKLGRTEDAQREAILASAVMQGILMTGDGSQAQPYLVLQISDEYDVLRHFAKTAVAQTMVTQDEKVLDRHDCEDGSAIWFDVTTPSRYR
jgi:hypothetical protein